MANATRPLDGVRVLDLSRVLSGPSCGKTLVDLGAEVIKIEPPEGDFTRKSRPRRAGIALYFAQQNTGKRCISLDLSTDEGRNIALEIAARSDVVLENFRPGVAARLGLGYEHVRERNPRVIYCSISGYGQDGPAAHRRAYAHVIHAEVGLMEHFARKHDIDPIPEVFSHGDVYAGLQASVGILAALHMRERTGEGQHIDVSMAETLLKVMEWTGIELAGGPDGFDVFGGQHAPVLTLGDGTQVVTPGDPVANFPAWCRAMGREELTEDERFATHEAREANRKAMLDVLQEWAATFTNVEGFEEAVGKVEIATGAVRTITEAADSEWSRARGALIDVGTESSGPIRLPNSPWRFSAADSGTRGRPAYQGEHNREVLSDVLGMSEAEIERLEHDGVLRSRPPKPEERAW